MDWRWFWRLKCPEKVKLFLRPLLNKALPTNFLRCKRELALSSCCPRCGDTVEEEIHCLQNYSFAASIWNAMALSPFIFGEHEHVGLGKGNVEA